MLRALCTMLTTWPFVGSLFVLVANDTWLKHAYPGVVSGKLSDFAGIAMVGLLLLTIQPNRRRFVFGAIIGGFTWWKSSLSQPVIEAINLYLPFPIGRTVDYTDLVALVVLPVCANVSSRPKDFAIPGQFLRRLLLAPTVALTLAGLMATSIMPTLQDFQVRPTNQEGDLDREAIADTIAHVAAQHGLQCEKECVDRARNGRYRGNGLYLKYTFVGAKAVSFEIEAYPNGLFFGTSGGDKADRLRNDLKSRLASSHQNLEYVERLGPKANGR